MSISNEQIREFSILLNETAEKVVDEYYIRFCDGLHQLCVSEDSAPIPPEVWAGLVQAMADASGYRVILQAAVLKESPENPSRLKVVGYCEITNADPTLFLATG